MPSVEGATGRSYDAFSNFYLANSDTNLRFRLSIFNEGAGPVACSERKEYKCAVSYSWLYTPYLHDVSPNQVYLDQDINIMVNSMLVHNETV